MPRREPNGYRWYGPEVLQRLVFICRAQAAALTLREIGQILTIRDEGRAPCVHVRQLLAGHIAEIEELLIELEAAKRELAALTRRGEEVAPETCPEDLVCAILAPER